MATFPNEQHQFIKQLSSRIIQFHVSGMNVCWWIQGNSLGVSLLQQSAPELPRGGRAAEEQHSIPADRKTVVNHHVHPTAEPPEPEMKDSCVEVGVFGIPLLIAVIGDHLAGGGGKGGGEKWRQGNNQDGVTRTQVTTPTFFHSDGSEARQEMAATIQQFPRLPWWRSRVLMPSTNRRGSLQISWGKKDKRRSSVCVTL